MLAKDFNRQRLVDELKTDEGFSAFAYNDVTGERITDDVTSSWDVTIGWGRNIEVKGITEQEAEIMLQNDVTEVALEVSKRLPIFDGLNGARQEALCNMAFTMGITRMLKFRRTIAALEAHDFQTAHNEILDSAWGRSPLRGHRIRCRKVAEMIRDGG